MKHIVPALLTVLVLAFSESSMAAAASPEWGETQGAVRTRLSVLTEDVKLGDPIRVRLEMENVGDVPVEYESPGKDFRIQGPDGAEAPCIKGLYSSYINIQTLQPAQTVVLIDEIDVDREYLFAEPGGYSVQFNGEWGIPASNTVHVELAPAPLQPFRQIALRLVPLQPETPWRFSFSSGSAVTPYGRQPGNGYCYMIAKAVGLRTDTSYYTICVTEEPAAVEEGAAEKGQPISEYLGKCEWGHVYLWARIARAEDWPTYREDISKALGVVAPVD